MKKVFTSIIICLIATLALKAQKTNEEILKQINDSCIVGSKKHLVKTGKESEIIFFGKPIKTYFNYGLDNGKRNIYTIQIIEINYFLKGKLNEKYIEVYSLGGIKDGKIEHEELLYPVQNGDHFNKPLQIEGITSNQYNIPRNKLNTLDSKGSIYCLKKASIQKIDYTDPNRNPNGIEVSSKFRDTITSLELFEPLDLIGVNNSLNGTNKFSANYGCLTFASHLEICKALNITYYEPEYLKKKSENDVLIKNQNKTENDLRRKRSAKHDKFSNEVYQKHIEQNQKKSLNQTKSNNADPEDCKKPFFSEFDNGPSFNKALEIFNPSNNPIDLTGYTIKANLNGQSLPITITLSGIISPKATYVITTVDADPNIVIIANKIVNNAELLNALQILLIDNNGNTLDKIGSTQLADWANINLTDFANNNFKRKFQIGKGDLNWLNGQTEWDLVPNTDFSNLNNHTNVCSPQSNTATFTLDNFTTYASNGHNYVEFNVNVSSSPNSYLHYTNLFISYNPAVFGNSIVANHKIKITRAAGFSTSYEDIDSSLVDTMGNAFNFVVWDDYLLTAWNRPQVTGTPQQMVRIKIEVAQCGLNPNIAFTNTTYTDFVTMWALSATSNALGSTGTDVDFYDNANTNNNITNANIPDCGMQISNLNGSTTTINRIGGDINNPQSFLTINGSHFGNSYAAGGHIYMKSADDGGATWVELNEIDTISWSDTQIKIKIPSYVLYNPVGVIPEVRNVGSGAIKVKNSAGDSVISNPTVIVDYSLYNIWNRFAAGYENKMRPAVSGLETAEHKVKFQLNSSVTDHRMIACIQKALKDWRCSTGINWYLDTQSTNADTIKQDSISAIFFRPIPFVAGTPNAIAQTFRNKKYCGIISNKMVYSYDIDLQIDPNDTINFSYDTTFTQPVPTGKNDFYHTILHELGHAAQLEHCNQQSSIMYPFISSGPIPANQRKTFIGIDNVHGGQDVVNLSATISFTNCNQTGNMIPATGGNCTGTSGERDTFDNQNNTLYVYPNPTNDLLNITYTINSNCIVKVQLINSIGQAVEEVSNEQSIGSYTLTVDTKLYSKGIYFIKFNDGKNIKQAKVILQ